MKMGDLPLQLLGKKKIVCVFIAMASATLLTAASYVTQTEYQVKSAFLYNFAKFTEWPPTHKNDGEFNICMVGTNPFGRTLEPIKSKTIKGQKINVIPYKKDQKCDIAYIGRASAEQLDSALAEIGPEVLTVSDISGFNRKGGMIEFFERDARILFRVNTANINRQNLKISAKILEIADSVD